MPGRSKNAELARETVAILDRGSYTLPDGRSVDLRDAMARAIGGTVLYRPADFSRLTPAEAGTFATRFEVANESTLAAAGRVLAESPEPGPARVLALNFASAKNPGGGFLSGAQAQEESLARSSGLYPCIGPVRGMYDANRACPTCLYTDHMIYSPDVPVIRDDDGALLAVPYPVSFLTAPAVNAGAVRRNEPAHAGRIGPVMRSRAHKVLAAARARGHDALVLGAWGCGVFRNDPASVAGWFCEHLTGAGAFAGAFRRVVFAVLDWSDDRHFIGPFERAFGADSRG